MDYVKGLQFEEKPDYKWIQAMFKDLFTRSGFVQDFRYDWTILQARLAFQLLDEADAEEEGRGVQRGSKVQEVQGAKGRVAPGAKVEPLNWGQQPGAWGGAEEGQVQGTPNLWELIGSQ